MLRLLQIKDQETEDHAGNVAKTKKKQVWVRAVLNSVNSDM